MKYTQLLRTSTLFNDQAQSSVRLLQTFERLNKILLTDSDIFNALTVLGVVDQAIIDIGLTQDQVLEIKAIIDKSESFATVTELEAAIALIPDVSDFVTTAQLLAVENKIPNVSDFVTRTYLDTKITTTTTEIQNWSNLKFATIVDLATANGLISTNKSDIQSIKVVQTEHTRLLSDVTGTVGETIKTEIEYALSQFDMTLFLPVAELPAEGRTNKIYLVPLPVADATDTNRWSEWVWVQKPNSIEYTWENIGYITLDINLETIATKAWVQEKYLPLTGGHLSGYLGIGSSKTEDEYRIRLHSEGFSAFRRIRIGSITTDGFSVDFLYRSEEDTSGNYSISIGSYRDKIFTINTGELIDITHTRKSHNVGGDVSIMLDTYNMSNHVLPLTGGTLTGHVYFKNGASIVIESSTNSSKTMLNSSGIALFSGKGLFSKIIMEDAVNYATLKFSNDNTNNLGYTFQVGSLGKINIHRNYTENNRTDEILDAYNVGNYALPLTGGKLSGNLELVETLSIIKGTNSDSGINIKTIKTLYRNINNYAVIGDHNFDSAIYLSTTGVGKLYHQKGSIGAQEILDRENALQWFLPVTGGTLTGILIGTTATFSGDVTIGGNIHLTSGKTLYINNNLAIQRVGTSLFIGSSTDAIVSIYSTASADINHIRNLTTYKVLDTYNMGTYVLPLTGGTVTGTMRVTTLEVGSNAYYGTLSASKLTLSRGLNDLCGIEFTNYTSTAPAILKIGPMAYGSSVGTTGIPAKIIFYVGGAIQASTGKGELVLMRELNEHTNVEYPILSTYNMSTYVLPSTGGIISGAIVLNNNIELQGKDTAGTGRCLIKMSAQNNVLVGNNLYPTYLTANNYLLYAFDGTKAYKIIHEGNIGDYASGGDYLPLSGGIIAGNVEIVDKLNDDEKPTGVGGNLTVSGFLSVENAISTNELYVQSSLYVSESGQDVSLAVDGMAHIRNLSVSGNISTAGNVAVTGNVTAASITMAGKLVATQEWVTTNTVTTNTAQAVSGEKTFSSPIILNNGISISGKNTTGAVYELIKIDNANTTRIGNNSYTTYIAAKDYQVYLWNGSGATQVLHADLIKYHALPLTGGTVSGATTFTGDLFVGTTNILTEINKIKAHLNLT